ncbi:MAG: chemotaxis response regulator protein-glutamate methylesterase [Rhodospirillaceae bacterium]|nr:chemotaxis response regulator protein-glutamate methylesterase [Rhodospirillaceae bacterium]
MAPAPPPMAGGAAPVVRVLLVDDSAVARGIVGRALQGNPALSVVGSVANGQMAVDFVSRNPVDVVVLDLEMPVMDGLTALPKILEKAPAAKVIVVSALTTKGAEISLKCLRAGAVDVIAKPSSAPGAGNAATFAQDLVERMLALAAPRRPRFTQAPAAAAVPSAAVAVTAKPGSALPPLRRPSSLLPEIIAIGSSTGGPQALFAVLSDLKKLGPVRQPIVITQHMPATFTTILASHISSLSGFQASEGKQGELLVGGRVYVAPGDFHMLFEKRDGGVAIVLSDGPKENFCRPAVDPMFRSAVDIYGGKVLAVVLTGMGADGAKGGAVVAERGGTVIAQDEASSVVWGMPGATARIGACSFILPLDQIASSISRLAGKG